MAKSIGVTGSSTASLKRFDDWYFDFYPYLFDHIPFEKMADNKVLEVGLGYGTVSQRLAESGAIYTGLDIASGPVEMVNHRLQQIGLKGTALQGSILEPPFSSESFDHIVAIGCLHHTGNLKFAIDQCYGLLKPGGSLISMVYYAYSYRRFRISPITTLAYLLRELVGFRGVVGGSKEYERKAYDAGSQGGAPHTDWISARSLEHLCQQFSEFSARIENIDRELPFIFATRTKLLETSWPRRLGLDLYSTATK